MKLTVNRSASTLLPIFLLVLAAACQPRTELKVNNSNSAVTNTAARDTANINQSATPKPSENSSSAEAGSLATPTEAYKTGYTARQKKDIEGLKRVLSKEAQQFLTDVGKEEKKTLDDQLKALAERPQAATAESRNEKITGTTATLEYLNENGEWSTMHFVKEGNDWKITLPKAEQ